MSKSKEGYVSIVQLYKDLERNKDVIEALVQAVKAQNKVITTVNEQGVVHIGDYALIDLNASAEVS